MIYLHENGLVHRDLKIKSVMLISVFEAEVIDSGLARIHECLSDGYLFAEDSLIKRIETLVYMSLKILNEKRI